MSRTMGQLAADLTDVIGFDVTQAKALEWLNERHKTMVGRGLGLKKTLTLAAGDGTSFEFSVPASVAEVVRVRVNGRRYEHKARDEIEQLQFSEASAPSYGRFFAVEADENGDVLVIWPTPPDAAVVTLLAAVYPDDLDASQTPIVPDAFAGAIVQGAAATGYAFDPEQLSTAAVFEQAFSNSCTEYRAWVKRRLAGAGPRTIRVVDRGGRAL